MEGLHQVIDYNLEACCKAAPQQMDRVRRVVSRVPTEDTRCLKMFRKAVDTILSFAFSRFASSTMDLSSFTSEAERTRCGVPEQAEHPPSTMKTSSASRSNLLYYLLSLGKDNASYYQGHISAASEPDERFLELTAVLRVMSVHIPEVEQSAARLAETAPLFDFPGVEGNGYRSLLQIVDACVVKLLEANVYMRNNREKFHFRVHSSLTDIRNYVEVLGTLRAMLKYTERMIDVEVAAGTHDLFPGNTSDDDNSDLLEDWLLRVETLDQTCFFGSCTAFHVCPSIRAALHTITTALATFAEKYQSLELENPGSGPEALKYLGSNLLASRKFIMDPELKAQALVTSTRELDITFCKAFWSVSESRFFEPVHWWMLPKADLNREILIEPESFTLPKIALNEGEMEEEVFIKPPSAHIGERPLMVRLLSTRIREGQLFIDANDTVKSYKLPSRVLPKSDYLLFHAHGGGFVAQSSKACDLYLREWADHLQIPILSVDYTLAPEGPYPRAVEETFYAYCWALRYAHKLGWTGKKIVLVGDSAGGNLVFGVAFQAFAQSIRMPDGILALYAPLFTRYTPSPSRVISLMDPLIPIGDFLFAIRTCTNYRSLFSLLAESCF
ncbi:hypothetical protein RvY_10002-2 [Ramazzottius varieornatus]|uniref:Hormone-sensitive lipase n=1 Tax=Ramazzottius varieornatus TaxID=947166 RepID=A0A1D1VDF9_RAMVA|nr:hypothetical protein RvY_10002-2 [Ramazzottius varieornatus]